MYQQRVTVRPNPEKVAEARALLVARAKATQASGQRVALGELVAGKHAPEFQVILLFDDLAAFEDPAQAQPGRRCVSEVRDQACIRLT